MNWRTVATASPAKQLIAAIESDALSPEELHELAHYDNHFSVRASVARSTIAMPKTYALLTKDQSRTVVSDLMGNMNLPVLTINLIMLDFDDAARKFAKHSRDTRTLLPIFAQGSNQNLHEAIPTNSQVTSEILALVAKSPNSYAKWLVARHEKTNGDTLMLLSLLDNFQIRQNVATNPNAPISLLFQFLKDDSAGLRSEAEANLSSALRAAELDEHFQSIDIENHRDLPIDLLATLF